MFTAFSSRLPNKSKPHPLKSSRATYIRIPYGSEPTEAGSPLWGSYLVGETLPSPPPAPALGEHVRCRGRRAAPPSIPHLRQSTAGCSFRKKHVELGEEKLPVSYNLKIKVLNMYSIYFQAAKICNNMLLAISMIGTAEAMNLGIRFVE